ncbi:hypothetical protein Pan161_23610 [Gimesia algae]|uniref:Uncharacterized protein n=1 Tax=Gimesia algae TaxID=2527971 RepID=A0A517VCI6_9PLAN|nr:hypothetical protein Pan161_23610 [Gimesia algae]
MLIHNTMSMDTLDSISVPMDIFEYFALLIPAANFYSTQKSEYDDYNECAYCSSELSLCVFCLTVSRQTAVNQFVQANAQIHGVLTLRISGIGSVRH